ncbi:MAG: hypothetical protein WCY33_06025, partial [Clostridia bacterium]
PTKSAIIKYAWLLFYCLIFWILFQKLYIIVKLLESILVLPDFWSLFDYNLEYTGGSYKD